MIIFYDNWKNEYFSHFQHVSIKNVGWFFCLLQEMTMSMLYVSYSDCFDCQF